MATDQLQVEALSLIRQQVRNLRASGYRRLSLRMELERRLIDERTIYHTLRSAYPWDSDLHVAYSELYNASAHAIYLAAKWRDQYTTRAIALVVASLGKGAP